MIDYDQLAFIDTETTGLIAGKHPIWEIAVIIGDEEHVWQQRLTTHQLRRHDPVAREMTRFDQRYDQDTALRTFASMERLRSILGDQRRHLVGAVVSFDEERLRRQWDALYGLYGGDNGNDEFNLSLRYPWHYHDLSLRYPWHYHLIDVEALAIGYLAAKGETIPLPWKSDQLTELLGLEPPQEGEKHTALADARWAKAIYERVMGS